ncbi:MAG TPA: potassium transporter Kup [Clostridia bacterium]|nr:potassium transporter Kup [Clostridia bacterium]
MADHQHSSPGSGHEPKSNGGPRGKYLVSLSIAALGVVYGDIGTSPLYTLKESFHHTHNLAVTPGNVMGVLSLIFWSLLIIVSIKYLLFVLRADNRGEGGIMALTSLVSPVGAARNSTQWVLISLGLFGTALLYGDGMITPAITVLGAIEGLSIATPVFDPYIEPITVVVLVLLFSIQNRGTARIGRMFGPIIIVWLVTIATLGLVAIVRVPQVLAAIDPRHGVLFLVHNGWRAFVVLGSVFLAITGAEALYADMGHFGRRPIRLAWFYLVLPALLLNYFGQGALLIADPSAVENPFYRLAPRWAIYPLVVLATSAAVIASQALISGAFSLTRQAVQLGYVPRVDIEHTSATEIGQIYIPGVNWALMFACIGLVLGFHSSSNLAAAYGIAVTLTMLITTVLFWVVARQRWHWSLLKATLICGAFLAIESAFFAANVLKIPHGGWFPLLIGAAIFTVMSTWKKGRRILAKRLRYASMPFDRFLRELPEYDVALVPGTAIYMSGSNMNVPVPLLQNLRHNKVLHERVILLHVATEETPHCSDEERLECRKLTDGIYEITAHYGFMEDPNITSVLQKSEEHGIPIDMDDTTFFLGREHLIATNRPGMAIWREKLFALMARNAQQATLYFRLPPNRVVEVGTQVEM